MKDRFLAILAWLGWTALGLQAMTSAWGVLVILSLIPDPRSADAGAWNGLLWLQLFLGPLLGNIIIRRLVRAASPRARQST